MTFQAHTKVPTDPAGKVHWLCAGGEVQPTHVRAELDNMVAALAQYHGEQKAQLMLGDAFAIAFARWARESGRPSVYLFSLEAAISQALSRQYGAPPDGPVAA